MKHFKNISFLIFIFLCCWFFYNYYYLTDTSVSDEFFFLFLILTLFLFLLEPLLKTKIRNIKFNISLLIIYFMLAAFTVRFSPEFFFIFIIPVISASLSFGMIGGGLTILLIFFIKHLQYIGNTDFIYEFKNSLPQFVAFFIISLVSGLIFDESKKYELRCFEKVNKIINLNFLKSIIEKNKSYNKIGKEIYLALKYFFNVEHGLCIFKSNNNYCLIIEDGIKIKDLNEISIIINITNSIINKPYHIYKIDNLKNFESILKLSILYDKNKHFEILLFRDTKKFVNEELSLSKIIKNNIELLLNNNSLYKKNKNTNAFFNEFIDNLETPIIISDDKFNILNYNSIVSNIFDAKSLDNVNFKDLMCIYLPADEINILFDSYGNYLNKRYNIQISKTKEIYINIIKNCYLTITGKINYIWTFYDLTGQKKLLDKTHINNKFSSIGEIIYYNIENIKKELYSPNNINRFTNGLIEKINNIISECDIKDKLLNIDSILEKIIADFENNNLNISIKKICNLKELFIKSNEIELNKLLNNILYNSVESIKSNGSIILHLKKVVLGFDEDNKLYLEMKIIDNGKGISKENIAKVFDPFWTTKTNHTGLGLTHSKKIVNKLNGSISIESIENNGTTVIILLPLVNI